MRKRPNVFSIISKGSVLEIERPGFCLPLRIRTWLAPGPFSRPLPWRLSASLFVLIPLEANLGLGSLRSKATPTTSSVLEPTKGDCTLLFVVEPVLMQLGVLGWVFVGIFFVFLLLLASVASHETLQWYQSNLVCIKIGLLLRVFSFWYPCFQKFSKMRFLV